MRVLNHQTTRSTTSELSCFSETETYGIYGYEDCFAIISCDDNSDAVLGYSMTSFNKDNIPCGLKWWLCAIDTRLKQMPIKASVAKTRGSSVVVEPMLKSKWGQGDPYNSKCPTFQGKQGPVGCVATAMSQLMYYYKYPLQSDGMGYYTLGEASHIYSYKINNTYDWEHMMDSYPSSWFITNEEKENISQLCYDAGLASHMNYASDGSGTTAYEAAYGLGSVFKFDSLSVRCVQRNYCSDEEWIETICKEFQSGRPLIMTGQDPNYGGHAFLIDGINAEGLVHVNWGWNGNSDGYYNLNDMNPISSNDHYNYSQTIVTNLLCNPIPSEGAKYKSRWCFDGDIELVSDQIDGLIISGAELIWQCYHIPFYGQVGLMFIDNNGNEALFCPIIDTSKNSMGAVAGGYGLYVSSFNHITSADLKSLSSGSYRAYFVSKALQDEEPQIVGYPKEGYNEFAITKSDDSSLTIEKTGATSIWSAIIQKSKTEQIYNLQGRNMGTDLNALPRGIYIIGGKKVGK